MKNVCLVGLIVVMLCMGKEVYAQHARELNEGYYVVVAVFAHEENATKYVSGVVKQGTEAKYGFNSEKGYFYVYVKNTPDLGSSVKEMMAMRAKEGFEKTWVRHVRPYRVSASTQPEPQPESPIIEEQPQPVVEDEPEETAAAPAPDTAKVDLKSLIVDTVKVEAVTTEVFVSMFNATNNRQVEGKIKIVDTEKAKLIKEQNGNDFLDLDPKRKPGTVTLICEAFGYRKVQQEIMFPVPLQDTVKAYIDLVGPTFIVNFDLVRYNKGDIATLYQVYFYNDAAIMLPESKFELNSLLQMMQENSGYRIRLHGHTNGNYTGKIILLGENKNFFSLDGSKNTTGTAKELSEGRAEIIKEYLVANGIQAERVEVKAWGGKRPIYDKNSANAKKNVRVEVEILEDKLP